MPVYFDLDPSVRPVRLSARPADTHPYDFDPAAVRVVRADHVQRGDVVLGEVYGHGPGRAAGVSYLPYGCIPYAAQPRPVDPACPCELCRQHRADPCTYLTDPVVLTVWPRGELGLDPVCQVNNADELLIIVPAHGFPYGVPFPSARPESGEAPVPSSSAPAVTEWLIVQDAPHHPHAPARPYSEAAERALREAGRTFCRVEAVSAGAADQIAQGMDWSTMRRADFDVRAPLALVEARAVHRSVPAVPHANGTGALFGDEAPLRPVKPQRRAQRGQAPVGDALFEI